MAIITLQPEAVARLAPQDRVFYLSKLSRFVSCAGEEAGPLSAPIELEIYGGGFAIRDGHHRALTALLSGLPLVAKVLGQMEGTPLAGKYGLKLLDDLLFTDIAQEQARFFEQAAATMADKNPQKRTIETGLRTYYSYLRLNPKPIITLATTLAMHKAVLNTLTEL